MMRDFEEVHVETAARLHFGVLDLRGTGGRWFGGLGAAAHAPVLLVSAALDDRLIVDGEDARRAAEFATRYLTHYGLPVAARIRVRRALPPHSGLGSGTQLALAVARALAELQGLSSDVRVLASAVGRARRSAVGTWTFADGGFVVEGGRPLAGDACGPLIARIPFPADWRCVLAIPAAGSPGLCGAAEDAVFAELPRPSERDVEKVAHLVLMRMLPAIADAELRAFGCALTEVQEITGRWFESVQGGAFAQGPSAEPIAHMSACGAAGVGQSSWGPAVYGIVAGEDAAQRLVEQVTAFMGGRGQVYEGPFRAQGARVWRARMEPD